MSLLSALLDLIFPAKCPFCGRVLDRPGICDTCRGELPWTEGPHDMPTHLLHDPEQYITRVGHFLRKTSLDELPQLWNIFVGDMAVIGPRPALWNQYDLLAERDKYGANDVRPGLTGWAQIHGRDELEIADKARLDGYYVEHLSFGMDVKCFFGTIRAVLDHDGVVEGGTGTLHEEENHKK